MTKTDRADRLRGELVRHLLDTGALADQRWVAAFREVPRHLFLPRWFEPDGTRFRAVADTAPDWLDAVYADRVLVTQLDGDPARWVPGAGPVSGVPTSSSSQPGIMAVMLEELLVRDGDRVLEVGAGTGYNAALLCHRVGDTNVSTVDIDGAVLEAARAHLALAGYHPDCATVDGALGRPGRAPFDRVLATCSVSRIPPDWLAQTVPGGFVVTTLHRPIGAGLVRITAGDGPVGEGRVLAQDGRFMPLRAHRRSLPLPVDRSGDRRETTVPGSTVLAAGSPFEFYAGLALPGAELRTVGRHAVLLHPDGSFAVPAGTSVFQGGPRRLWDEVEAAHRRWQDLGEPGRDRFGITVDGADQHLWLDSPDGERWPL